MQESSSISTSIVAKKLSTACPTWLEERLTSAYMENELRLGSPLVNEHVSRYFGNNGTLSLSPLN